MFWRFLEHYGRNKALEIVDGYGAAAVMSDPKTAKMGASVLDPKMSAGQRERPATGPGSVFVVIDRHGEPRVLETSV